MEIETQDDIQENTDSMEEKLESLQDDYKENVEQPELEKTNDRELEARESNQD